MVLGRRLNVLLDMGDFVFHLLLFWGGGKGGEKRGVSLRTLPVSHHCGRGYLCHMLRYCSVSFTFFLQNVCCFPYLGASFASWGAWLLARSRTGQGIGQGMAGQGMAGQRGVSSFSSSSSLFLFSKGFLSRGRRRGFSFFVWVGSFPFFFVSLY